MKKILITGSNGFIGTNFIQTLRDTQQNYEAILVDIVPPKIALNSNEKWFDASIMDEDKIENIFSEQKPDTVVHFAALTSTLPHFVASDYLINTEGSRIVFDACEKHGVEFVVHTSTQFVHQTDGQPESDTDFAPHTVYGESKVTSEKILREEKYTFNWAIIRPTNVWGPWHLRYPYEFWKIVRDGKYFHPGNKTVMRSYAYVGNVCLQIKQIIDRRNDADISKQVFYVGDRPINLYDWANAFSQSIIKRNVVVIPSFAVYGLALVGSFLQKFRVKFPITLSRYKSMTSDNPAPMEKTMQVLGESKYTLQEGVKISTDWLIDFWEKEKKS